MSSSYSTVLWFSLYLLLLSEEHGLGCPPPLPLGKTNYTDKDDICFKNLILQNICMYCIPLQNKNKLYAVIDLRYFKLDQSLHYKRFTLSGCKENLSLWQKL